MPDAALQLPLPITIADIKAADIITPDDAFTLGMTWRDTAEQYHAALAEAGVRDEEAYDAISNWWSNGMVLLEGYVTDVWAKANPNEANIESIMEYRNLFRQYFVVRMLTEDGLSAATLYEEDES